MADMQDINCKKCGAPLKIPFGTSVLSCSYCGSAMTIEGAEGQWKEIQKHTMMVNATPADKASAVAQKWMDEGLLRSGIAKNSSISEIKLQYIPYWIMPIRCRTEFSGTSGSGIAGLKNAASGAKEGNLGGLLGGLMNAGMSAKFGSGSQRVSRAIDKSYDWPVIAVRGLENYVVNDYQFAVAQKQLFDPSKLKDGEILNGDVTESEAKQKAQGTVCAFQENDARSQMDTMASINSKTKTEDGELMHAAIWFVKYNFGGKDYYILVDGGAGKVIKGERPAYSINR
jgi:hypothetical protein